MTVDELQVLITANTNELRKEINKANSNISGLQKSATKSTTGVSTAFKKLKTGIIALGIGKVIKDSITMGMDAIESDSLFETSLGKSADAVRSWSDEVSNTLGLNAVAMRKNTGVIYNMTSSMGVAEDNALKMSKGISLLSEDMASFYNLDSAEAFNKLRAGLTGETEPLKALGILVDENTVKQVAYSEGIAQNGAELTQQQKVLARYVAILKQTGNAQGDLARTINSPSNQLRILKQQVTNLGIAFSNFLMPIISAVLPYITAFAKVVTQALNGLAGLLGLKGGGGDASKETKKISDNVGGLAGDYDKATKSAKKLKGSLAGFDEMNVLQDKSSDSAGASGGGGGATGGDLGFNLDEYDAHLDWIEGGTNEIAEKIKTAFSKVGDVIKKAWNSEPVQAFKNLAITYGGFVWDYYSTLGGDLINNAKTTWGNVSGNVSTALTNLSTLYTQVWTDMSAGIETWGQPIIDGVSGVFNSIWTDAIDPVLQLATQMWADFTGILVELWDEHGKPLIDNVGEFVVNIIALFQSIWDNILEPIITPFLQMLSKTWDKYLKPLIKTVGDFVMSLVNGALEIYNKFISPIVLWIIERLKPTFEYIGNIVSTVMGAIIGVISSIINGIIGFFTGLIDFIVGVFTGNWKKAWDGIKKMFSSVWNGIKGVASAVWDGIKGIFSSVKTFFVSKWNDIKSVFSSVGTWFSGIFSKAWEGIKKAFSKVKSFFTGIWDSIKEIFGKVGKVIADAVTGTVKKAINTVLSTAIKVINGFISAINLAISAINLIPGVDIKKLNKLEVPKLARGGIIDRPTIAMVGEAGKEAVMPLERNTGWIDQLASKLGDKLGGASGNIKLIVKLGEEAIFDRFIEYGKEKAFETNGEVVFI